MGLTWAAIWFGAGMVLLLIVGLDAADVPFPLFFGLLGFLAGATFSGLLALAEGRQRFEQLSMKRVSGWGALGGLLLSVGLTVTAGLGGEALLLGGVFAVSGAICAGGTLALARRAEAQALPTGRTGALPGEAHVATRSGSTHGDDRGRT